MPNARVRLRIVLKALGDLTAIHISDGCVHLIGDIEEAWAEHMRARRSGDGGQGGQDNDDDSDDGVQGAVESLVWSAENGMSWNDPRPPPANSRWELPIVHLDARVYSDPYAAYNPREAVECHGEASP